MTIGSLFKCLLPDLQLNLVEKLHHERGLKAPRLSGAFIGDPCDHPAVIP
jgi:hypothetical protein